MNDHNARRAAELIQRVIGSLDRICPACMAATSQETWDLLHHGRECKTRRSVT